MNKGPRMRAFVFLFVDSSVVASGQFEAARNCTRGREPHPRHCEARSAAAVHAALPPATAAWMAAGLTALAMTVEVRPCKRKGMERSEAANPVIARSEATRRSDRKSVV